MLREKTFFGIRTALKRQWVSTNWAGRDIAITHKTRPNHAQIDPDWLRSDPKADATWFYTRRMAARGMGVVSIQALYRLAHGWYNAPIWRPFSLMKLSNFSSYLGCNSYKVKDNNHMSTAVAHKSKWQSSEAVFGIPFLAAIALQLVVPFSFPRFLTPALITVGAVFIIMGVTLIVLAHREFAQHGQPTAPGIPTTNLVTSGVFSISRNPIYLGVVCFLAGVALAINLPWVLVLLLPSFVACHYVLIAPEEKYLIARFGDEYRVYKATAYRWIGHTRISRED